MINDIEQKSEYKQQYNKIYIPTEYINVKYKYTISGEVAFWLTDNLPEMFLLNDEACWLYTESTKNKNGETIAIKVSELPQFTRYDINKEQNAVISSWDFAVPKENYFGEVKYEDSSTIYSRFWERYFSDRYDVNTKKVECNVNLLGLDVTKENLRNIYYLSIS